MSIEKYTSFLSAPISTAHTYGNVTAFITEKIKSWFHPDFFKTVNVSSTIASHNFKLLRNTNGAIFKKEKPYLTIVPRFAIERDTFLNNTLMTNRYSEDVPGYDSGNLFTFVEDKPKGLVGKYIVNRDKITFDVTIFVDTAMGQINIAKMLRNRVLFDKPLNWYTNLECQIPREVMSAISYMSDIPLTDPPRLLEYVNGIADGPVTYMMKHSTGNDEYFKYYNAQIDAVIIGLSLSDGNKKNFVDDYFTLNFTIEAEFFTVGEFFMYTTPKQAHVLQTGMREFTFDDLTVHNGILGDNAKGTLSFYFTPYEDLGIPIQPGWKVVAESGFKVEKRCPDIVPFEGILHQRYRDMIDYHLKNNIPLDKLLDIQVVKDMKVLSKVDGDYTVDFETLELYVYNISSLSTYRVIIIFNNNYVNELALHSIRK